MNKKIIFIHLLNDYSGSPKVLSQVIEAFKKNGDQTLLFIGSSGDGFLSNEFSNHYFYRRFENKYLTLFTYMVSQICLFFKLLKFRNQDVVIYINTMLPFGAALAGKVMGKRVYYHIHEISLRPLQLKRFLRFFVQKIASKVVFVSQSVQKAEFFAGINQFVIHNALPWDFIHKEGTNYYQWKNDGKFSVLMVCSLKDYKGVNEFVDIAQRCFQIKDIAFTLILNAEQNEINLYFSEFDLPANLSIVSRQTNLKPYYQNTSLLLNLSRVDEWVETFGLTIIEAMSFGIPVIVPPVGGPTEFVTEGIEGFLISSYEVDKISFKIIELSRDQQKCLDLSKHAKQRTKDFMPNVFEKNIVSVISE